MSLSPLQELAKLPEALQRDWLARQPDWAIADMVRREWWWVGRPEQQTPAGRWFIWLILTGRGWGKTQTGAEWIVDRALRYPLDVEGRPTEHLIVAETLSDGMQMCIGGPSGVRRVLERRLGPESRFTDGRDGKLWHLTKSPKPFIEIFTHNQKIHLQGADDEDVGRGYNLVSLWGDEYAKWPKPDGSWAEGLMPALRINVPGDHPRAVFTTTPKPVVQIIEWRRETDGSVVLTTGSIYDNADNLAPVAVAALHKKYHGTRLGRQELHGELLEEVEGALWNYDMIEPYRVDRDQVPELLNTVVAIDPPGGDDPQSDLCGLVAVGRGVDDRDYVLADWSKRVVGAAAARRAWEMFREYGASKLIYEDNQGKKWVRQVLVDVYQAMQDEGLFPPGGSPPLLAVTAKVGKKLRAEPAAARYEQGRVSHVRSLVRNARGELELKGLGDLETQQCTWVPEETPKSPDRVDALVYAILYLVGREHRPGQLVSPAGVRLPATTASPLAGGPLPGGY